MSRRKDVSFNQMVTVYACVLGAVLVALIVWFVVTQKTWPPTTIVGLILSFLTVVIGAGFGLKGYLGGINQKAILASAQATDTTSLATNLTVDAAKVIDAIKARRDPERGVDPS